MSPKRTFLISGLTAIALLALVVVTARLFRPVDTPAYGPLAPASLCNLSQQSCSVFLEAGQSLSLSATPLPTPAGRPIFFSLSTQGIVLDLVEIEFEGVEMNMGVFRSALSKIAGSQFSGQAVLPLCITGPMQWRLRLFVVGAGIRREASFLLDTVAVSR